MSLEMGYGMGGIEDRIVDTANDVAKMFDSVTYVELGVGRGETLSAISATLKAHEKKWRTVGVELPNGYSFDRDRTSEFARFREIPLSFVTPNSNIVRPAWEAQTVFFKDSQSFLTELWQEPIQFAMIDACHGKPCVILDFLALEAFMVPGSIVMFHDFGEDQKGHHQPHCPSGLDVRGAVGELGLLNGKRKGWTYMGAFIADRFKGGWDMGLFRRDV